MRAASASRRISASTSATVELPAPRARRARSTPSRCPPRSRRDTHAARGSPRAPRASSNAARDAPGTSPPRPSRTRAAATPRAPAGTRSSAVQSTVRNVVTCGTSRTTAVNRSAIVRRAIEIRSTSKSTSTAGVPGDEPPAAACTSSAVIRPPGPVARHGPEIDPKRPSRACGPRALRQPRRAPPSARTPCEADPGPCTSNVTRTSPTGTASPTSPCTETTIPGERRRDLDRRLRRLDLHERLVQRDRRRRRRRATRRSRLPRAPPRGPASRRCVRPSVRHHLPRPPPRSARRSGR